MVSFVHVIAAFLADESAIYLHCVRFPSVLITSLIVGFLVMQT